MMGYGWGVSQFTPLYLKITKIYKIIPFPHVGIYEGEKGNILLKKMDIRIGGINRTVCVVFNKSTSNSKVLDKFGVNNG